MLGDSLNPDRNSTPHADPEAPDTLLPAFDHGDHTHPNDAGYKAMADAVRLDNFLN